MKKNHILLNFLICVLLFSLSDCRNPGTNDSSKESLKQKDTMLIDTSSAKHLEIQDTMHTKEKKQPGPYESAFISAGLVNLKDIDSTIQVKLRYSTPDNFLGFDIYGDLEDCFLQEETALQLKKAQQYLKDKHPDYSLLVWDGVRPLRVQQMMWDSIEKPEHLKRLYVANPKKTGSIHNYGCGVDVTIINTQSSELLDMGTDFDYFGTLAYPYKEKELLEKGVLTETQVKNRQLLRSVMTRAGFFGTNTEWWHFSAMTKAQARQKYEMIK